MRNGTTNLYAALDTASGKVIAEMTPRHRAEEFRKFLNLVERGARGPRRACRARQLLDPQDAVRLGAGSNAHPRFVLHFTPTYSSWLNLVERWFAELTTKWMKRGPSLRPRLAASIRASIAN